MEQREREEIAGRTRPCRGADSRARRRTCSPYRLPIKRYAPIASVAALSERPVGEHSTAWGAGAPPRCLTCHCEERSDVAISGRHSQFVQAAVKTHGPIASVAAVSDRLAEGHETAGELWAPPHPPDVSLRGRQLHFRRWLSHDAAGNCEIAPQRALPRASRSGRHVGLRPPRNDKFGGFAPLNLFRDHCQSAWRSLSAATDAIGACHLTAVCTGCQCLPEIATAPLGPRNDKSGPLPFSRWPVWIGSVPPGPAVRSPHITHMQKPRAGHWPALCALSCYSFA